MDLENDKNKKMMTENFLILKKKGDDSNLYNIEDGKSKEKVVVILDIEDFEGMVLRKNYKEVLLGKKISKI